MMRNFLHKAFSKALILTYIFIGYLAITTTDKPQCVIYAQHVMQTDPTTVPSSVTIKVFAARHIQPEKLSRSIAYVSLFDFVIPPACATLLRVVKSTHFTSYNGFSIEQPARAPPIA